MEEKTQDGVSDNLTEESQVKKAEVPGKLAPVSNSIKFYATYFISVAVLFFAFFKLSSSTLDNETPLWVGVVTSVASQYMPSPLFNK